MKGINVKKVETDDLIEIREILGSFGADECMKCGSKDTKAMYFIVNKEPQTQKEEEILDRIMKDDFGIDDYGVFFTGEKTIITTAKCQKCGSQEMFWDY